MRIGSKAVLTAAIAGLLAAGCSAASRASAPVRHGVSTTTGASAPSTTTSAASATSATAAFVAQSVTFVSPERGWVLGTTDCGSSSCRPIVLQTVDGGQIWKPGVAPPEVGAVPQIRFANDQDGWIYTSAAQSGRSLWETHNGGATWNALVISGLAPGGAISDLEAAEGRVYVAYTSVPVQIASSPVAVDDWSVSPTTLEIGAGPVPSEQVVLQGSAGWVVEVDRTVIAGARLVGSSWQPWTPPCTGEVGPVFLTTAGSPNDLAALCQEGAWGGPPDQTVLFTSSNGGNTFQAVGAPLSENTFGPVASAAPGEVVVGVNGSGLLATFDDGMHWSTIYPSSADNWAQVGFTTSTQGVAITQSGTMLMTYDGGHQWSPVNFPEVD